MFNWIINTHELRDLVLNGGLFTWSNNHSNPTLEKLDRVLMSSDWETEFPLTNLRKIPRYMSDHDPLILCTNHEKVKKKPKSSLLKLHGSNMLTSCQKFKKIWERQVIAKNAVEKWYIKINRVKIF